MILKAGICSIAMALGVALFVPRQFGGLSACVFLLVIGMVAVCLHDLKFGRNTYGNELDIEHNPASEGQSYGDDIQEADNGSSTLFRRTESQLFDSPVRGRHSAPETDVEDSPPPTP